MSPRRAAAWPSLPLDEWRETYALVHRLAQMVGKTRLALVPPQNHGWHCALYLTSRGLGTLGMPDGARQFDAEIDFVDHELVVRRGDGASGSIALGTQSVAQLFDEYRALLASLDCDVRLWPMPSEIAGAIRFDEDVEPRAYDRDAVARCWQALVDAQRPLLRFRSGFIGKCSPVHFWWGGFDLACTRFSGRTAPVHPGGIPNLADRITREAYSHECISAGWWPGSIDGVIAEPAFYAYAYPEPAGCATAPIAPDTAYYHQDMREWILPWNAVRESAHPDADVEAFLRSTYEVAANLGGWDRVALERRVPS